MAHEKLKANAAKEAFEFAVQTAVAFILGLGAGAMALLALIQFLPWPLPEMMGSIIGLAVCAWLMHIPCK